MKITTRIKGFVLGAAVAITAGACGPGTENGRQDQDIAGTVAPTFENEQMAAAYRHYIQLKDALVASGQSEAGSAAAALKESLQGIPQATEAINLASVIADEQDIAGQRAAFSELSKVMTTLVKNAGVRSGEIFLAFCPMANDNTGAFWLANEQEIRNPYFGEKMMKCGEVKETVH